MKAKNILRISVFAALLCIMTIFGAFAAETNTTPDAKIIRFDGMGNVAATLYNSDDEEKTPVGSVTADGTLKIELPVKAGVASSPTIRYNFNLGSETFNLYDYPYAKIKFKTNYADTNFQWYVSPSSAFIYTPIKTTADKWDVRKLYYPHQDEWGDTSDATTVWKAVPGKSGFQYRLEEKENGNVTSNYQLYLYDYVGWKDGYGDARVQTTGGATAFPTEASPLPISNAKPIFMMIRGISTDDLAKVSDDYKLVFEIEYVAFFKNEADMKAYNGREDSKSHARIIRWDGLGNIEGSVLDNGKIENGVYKYTLPVGSSTVPTSAISCNIAVNDQFTLYDYPYVATKFKTNFTTGGSQWYIRCKGGYIYSNYETKPNTWNTNRYYYPKASEFPTGKYTTKYNTWVNLSDGHYPDETDKIILDSPFFHFRDFNESELNKVKAGNDSFVAEIEYVAFFDSEEAMQAYGTSEENTAIAGINTAVTTILNDKTEYKFTMHPAISDKNKAVVDYVKSILEDKITVGYEAKIDESNSTDELYKVLLTFESKTYTKTIGINVKITELADITPNVKGAQIRTDGTTGLRFGFVYSDKTTGYTDVQYGALLAGKEALGDNEITIDKVDTLKNSAEQPIIANVIRENIFDTTDHIYTAVVTNIPEAQNDTVVVAVPYVKYKVGETEYVAYGEQIERSYSGILQDNTGNIGK